MANRDYTPHQQKIIKRYYDNREQIDEQRLAELVTNLYLASDKKKKKLSLYQLRLFKICIRLHKKLIQIYSLV